MVEVHGGRQARARREIELEGLRRMASFGARGAEALAAHRQAQEDEAARLRSLRAAGVEDECEYVAVDWDAPHGAWLVPVPELLDVPSPDPTSGRVERRAFEAARSARAATAADVREQPTAVPVTLGRPNANPRGGEPKARKPYRNSYGIGILHNSR